MGCESLSSKRTGIMVLPSCLVAVNECLLTALSKEVVTVSHFSLERLRQMGWQIKHRSVFVSVVHNEMLT